MNNSKMIVKTHITPSGEFINIGDLQKVLYKDACSLRKEGKEDVADYAEELASNLDNLEHLDG